MHRWSGWRAHIFRLVIVNIAVGVIWVFCFPQYWLPSAVAADNWYDNAWRARVPLIINHTQVVDGPHANFPVLITLTSNTLSAAQSDGDDFLFTAEDGVTKLDYEIEAWNNVTHTLSAWVKVPVLNSLNDTNIYLYLGNPQASSGANSAAVWSENFQLVQHMNAANNFFDASGNGNNGTARGGLSVESGKAAQAVHFDGVDDMGNIPSSASLNMTDAVTVSFWMKNDTAPALYDGIMGKPNDYWTDSFGFYFGSPEKLQFFVNDWAANTAFATVNPTSWNYVVGVYDGTTVQMYSNGVEGTSDAYSGPLTINDKPFSIGRLSSNDYNIDGLIDEVRVANSARSPGWIVTEFNNQNQPESFVAMGNIEEQDESGHFVVTGPNSFTAGVPQNITLTAKNSSDTVKSSYDGDKTIIFSGADMAVRGNIPTCTDKNNNAIALGQSTNIHFVAGVGTCRLSLFHAGNYSIDAADGAFNSEADAQYDLDIAVAPAALGDLSVSHLESVQSGEALTLVIAAQDAYGNFLQEMPEAVTLSVDKGTILPDSVESSTFFAGVATTTVVMSVPTSSQVMLSARSGVVVAPTTSVYVNVPPIESSNSSGGGVHYVVGPAISEPFLNPNFVVPLLPTSTLPQPALPTSSVTPLPISPLPQSTLPRTIVSSTSPKPTTIPQPISSSQVRNPSRALVQPKAPVSVAISPKVSSLSSLTLASTALSLQSDRDVKVFSQWAGAVKQAQHSGLAAMPTLSMTVNNLLATDFIPLSAMTSEQKRKIPTQVLFATMSDRPKDLPVLAVKSGAQVRRELRVGVPGDIDIAVKPNASVSAIKGYILTSAEDLGRSEIAGHTLDFEDADKDGIYVAKIPSQQVRDKVEVMTVFEYSDSVKNNETISLQLRVSGGQVLDNEHKPVENAFVTLYRYNEQKNVYERWVAEDYGQSNPVLTDSGGFYLFSTPTGTYKLVVKHDNFSEQVQEKIEIRNRQDINVNVSLTSIPPIKQNWWQKIKSWF